ncbi:MAG: hypothetical protein H6625_05125 [Bdellovibrionaceae bacterium]|nr:hypothetical protein [Pseudobdellovibrionaceae bacterium]
MNITNIKKKWLLVSLGGVVFVAVLLLITNFYNSESEQEDNRLRFNMSSDPIESKKSLDNIKTGGEITQEMLKKDPVDLPKYPNKEDPSVQSQEPTASVAARQRTGDLPKKTKSQIDNTLYARVRENVNGTFKKKHKRLEMSESIVARPAARTITKKAKNAVNINWIIKIAVEPKISDDDYKDLELSLRNCPVKISDRVQTRKFSFDILSTSKGIVTQVSNSFPENSNLDDSLKLTHDCMKQVAIGFKFPESTKKTTYKLDIEIENIHLK